MTDRITFAGKVTADGRRLRGAVQIAGSRTWRAGEWLEVDPAALVKADATNVYARPDHDEDAIKILGRTTNGTLRLSRTDQGIEYEVDLPTNVWADAVLDHVQRGDFAGSSFAIEGLRSSFSTEPDGTRVRRITSIARLVDVSPVVDPAFVNSSVAAFSKESEVTDPIIVPEPVVPAPVIAPVVVPITPPKDEKSELFRRAHEYAKDQSLDQLAEQMGNIIALGSSMSAAEQERYDAFASVYEERKRTERESRERFERIQLADQMRRGVAPKAPEGGLFGSDDYSNAWFERKVGYLFTGDSRRLEQFAQTVSGDGTQGGFTVPDGFLNRTTTRLKAFGGIASVSDEITTSTGESLRWPYLDDTSNKAAIASEGVQVASGGADLVFDSIELGAFEYDATGTGNAPVEISLTLLQDSAVDIEGRLADALGTRIGRKQADHLATGAGSTEPVGLLSKTLDVMTATVVSLAGPEHIFQVDAEYRRGGNCRWVMSDTTLVKLVTAQTTTNEPMFTEGGNLAGAPFGRFYGFPIVIDPAAGNLVGFGDIKAGYIIRRVRGIQLLVDPYTAQKRRAVAYHAWARMDANIQDANAYSVSTWASVTADT